MPTSDCQDAELSPATLGQSTITAARTAPSRKLSYSIVAMSGGLLLVLDLVVLVIAASVSLAHYTFWFGSAELGTILNSRLEQAALIAAVLAPFILYEQRFGPSATNGQVDSIMGPFVLRFMLWVMVGLALSVVFNLLGSFPRGWLLLWIATSLLLTSLTRITMMRYVRRLQRRGVLTEVVAIVGSGPLADRLVHTLFATRSGAIELLGVFDDKIVGAVPSKIKSSGNIAKLIELGKTQKIDWILLTLPPTAEYRVLSIVQRLKSLSAPIGLCPQHVGLQVPFRTVEYVCDDMPVSVLADRPTQRWESMTRSVKDFLPRWIVTLIVLPFVGIAALVDKLARHYRVTRLPQQLANASRPFQSPLATEPMPRRVSVPRLHLVSPIKPPTVLANHASEPLATIRAERASRATSAAI